MDPMGVTAPTFQTYTKYGHTQSMSMKLMKFFVKKTAVTLQWLQNNDRPPSFVAVKLC